MVSSCAAYDQHQQSTLTPLPIFQEGVAELGEHNIIPNYFEQNQAEALDLEETVIGTLQKAGGPDAKLDEIKRLLGQMMFSGKAMEKQVTGHITWAYPCASPPLIP